VSRTYRNYCRPPTGTASATCRPGTGTQVSSIYRARTNSLRPERRSTDGQVILEAISDWPEEPSDLLLCGAPLRNRTVDLLLTMDHQRVPESPVASLNRQNTSSRWRGQAHVGPHWPGFAPQNAPRNDLHLTCPRDWLRPPSKHSNPCLRPFTSSHGTGCWRRMTWTV
jgi:hypothetical protein